MAERINPRPLTQSALHRQLFLLQNQQSGTSGDLAALQEQVDNLHTEEVTADESLTAGQIVRKTGATTVALARANTITNAAAIGAATANISMSATGRIKFLGEVSRPGWGLTPGAVYYLSATTPGEIVAVPNASSAGEVVIIVGRAKTATTLIVDIEIAVLL